MRLLAALQRDNHQLLKKLAVIVVLMFGFSYSLVYFYDAICRALGINVLSLAERQVVSADKGLANGNGQVDYSREITVEFDANARGPWDFKPAVRHMTVHPGQLSQVMYEFRNKQDRTMAAQAIPSYAPMQASAHFNKLECFCFNEYTLKPGETKQWPVVFVIDPKLPKDVKTITLSYTFFEVAGKGGFKVGEAQGLRSGAGAAL
ncbi:MULTISPECIES: cytochrome c oxidase assembly protein [unclassified Roseateles]|uniref:cytochrome c oxidase assembly protein n=1 Tax=unclassified Roseateles TaxID=2626991 RepID=UPI0006F40C7D|nr:MULTISPECIES: cytochrome c oxidase assembly protein [unclassified Roseateles]KQW51822.1 cytochrome C oxidase assembly protein [Pelomonas sp. Root405]KRA78055.1 cytochrome C oxidase assembly protein [Pelomonas sp. Root662]